jgi:hypothetical protein
LSQGILKMVFCYWLLAAFGAHAFEYRTGLTLAESFTVLDGQTIARGLHDAVLRSPDDFPIETYQDRLSKVEAFTSDDILLSIDTNTCIIPGTIALSGSQAMVYAGLWLYHVKTDPLNCTDDIIRCTLDAFLTKAVTSTSSSCVKYRMKSAQKRLILGESIFLTLDACLPIVGSIDPFPCNDMFERVDRFGHCQPKELPVFIASSAEARIPSGTDRSRNYKITILCLCVVSLGILAVLVGWAAHQITLFHVNQVKISLQKYPSIDKDGVPVLAGSDLKLIRDLFAILSIRELIK